MTDLAFMPDGHLRARIAEIDECIRTDEKHLQFLKSERVKYWQELAVREMFPKLCPDCKTEMEPVMLFDDGGQITAYHCKKCGRALPI